MTPCPSVSGGTEYSRTNRPPGLNPVRKVIMANRWFNQFRKQLEKEVVDLWATVTIGSTGAPTLVTAKSKGVSSIVRNSAGTYTVTLQDTYQRLLDMDVTTQNATGISASPNVSLKGAPTVNTISAPALVFVCSTGGTATDPASGDTLYVKLSLSNSTAV